MFRKDGKAFAYKWSVMNDMWEEVGEVAGTAPGRSMGGPPPGSAPKPSGDVDPVTGEAAPAEPTAPELSMEERKQLMEKRILDAKAAKEAAAKKEARAEEAKRRAMGKEGIESKEAREKMVRDREIAERKREKEADIAYKKKLLASMAADKEARKRKAQGLPEAAASPPPAAAVAKPATKKEHTQCIIMLRMLDGGSQKISFKPNETVGDVHAHVATLCMGGTLEGWALSSMFPRENYTKDKHGMTLTEAGLVPKAQLAITRL